MLLPLLMPIHSQGAPPESPAVQKVAAEPDRYIGNSADWIKLRKGHGAMLRTIFVGGVSGCQTIPNRTQVDRFAMGWESQGPLVGTAPGRVRKGY